MKKLIPLTIILVLFSTGCNLPQITIVNNSPEPPAVIVPQPTVDLANAVNATLTALIPEVAPLPQETSTPQPTFTSTSSKPTISVSTATNCRTGPGKAYDLVGGLLPGETTEIVGRNQAGDYWVVRNPDNHAAFCWLWGYYATPLGDLAALPIFTPPPSPTPAPGFSVSFVRVEVCAPMYAFRFLVTNTGQLTWESVRVNITDNTTANTTSHTLDAFRVYDGCILESETKDLFPGEAAMMSTVNPGQINYNPTGNSITAVVTVCTANGLGGTCVSQTINFVP
jgi:hypothetical protein